MELSIFSAATALIAAAALTWLVLRFFFGTQKATAGAMDASGERQSATITVKGGYSPAVISMRTGTPITLTFDRQETGECTSHVVFADLGLTPCCRATPPPTWNYRRCRRANIRLHAA